MERLQRVARIWSWLPAFRAVGETQHVRRAAESLHIAPSALSRTIGLVEADVGSPLFRRVGRGIALTSEGRTLLDAVRDAMRMIHDALGAVESGSLAGDINISAPGTLTRMFLLPGLDRLRQAHPQLRPVLANVHSRAIAERLRKGELDVAFTNEPVVDPALALVAVGHYSSGVYCGRDHPLALQRELGAATLGEYGFVTPPVDDRGLPPEGWPAEIPRRVELVASDVQVGIAACRGGRYLGVFADRLVGTEVARGELLRLDLDVIAPTPIFATHRRSTGTPSPAEALVRTVLDVLGPDAPAA